MRLLATDGSVVLHFRLLHTDNGKIYNEMRFNDNAFENDEDWGPAWSSPIPDALVKGINKIEVYIEVETYQVRFNGVHIDLEESMPVIFKRLGSVDSLSLDVNDGHMEFRRVNILTPKTGNRK